MYLRFLALFLTSAALAATAPNLQSLPLRFEPNRGQAGQTAAFAARSNRMALSLRADGAMVAFRNGEAISMMLEGADAKAPMVGEQPLEGAANYLLGSRREDWISGVPGYGRVRASNVYPGIDLVYYGNNGMIEYDFVVAPHANPSLIRLRFGGAAKLSLDATGDLVIGAGHGALRQRRPVIYQDINGRRIEVAGTYRLDKGNRVRFQVGAYDTARPLVIDPVLTYSTYLGGSGDEGHYGALAVDSTGATYIAGESVRLTGMPGDYPTTPGALRTTSTAGTRSDAVISKLSSDGSRLIYSTYIGGSAGDVIMRVAVGPEGSLYFLGHTDSTDFPVTAGVMQTTHRGGRFDAFLGRLNADGSQLIFSTYIGGAGADLARGLVPLSNRIIVGLQTESSGLPTSTGAAQDARAGATDLYIVAVRPDGGAPLLATYFGGSGTDELNDVQADESGSVLVTGRTASANFPTLGDTAARAGANDAFVVKLSPVLATVFSRLIGGSASEAGIAITAGPNNDIYVTGDTNSPNFPTTPGAYQTALKGDADAFVAKLSHTGAITYITLLGGQSGDAGYGISVDPQGTVALAGFSMSPDFPLTADAWQTGSPLEYAQTFTDAFLAALNPSGSALLFSSLLGGNFSEEARALHVSSSGTATIVGFTQSDDMPVTAGAIKPTLGACRTDLNSACQRFFITKVELNQSLPDGPKILLNGVVGAADYSRGGVSPGDVITIYGSGLGPNALVGLQLTADGTVARMLGETRVLFDDEPAALVYTLAGQVSAVVPYDFGERQTTTLVVEYQGRRSNPVVLPLRGSRMSLFTANSSGTGPAAALNADNSVNSASNPVARRSVIVLYGTGMGALDPTPAIGGVNGVPLARAKGTVTATIGGRPANVLYAGGAPGLIAGVVQVNLEIPPDAPTGGAVEVEVQVDGYPSQPGVTIAVR